MHRLRLVVAYVLCASIWGTTWFAIRRCIGQGGFPTFTAAALRFALATAVLAAAYAAGRGRPGPRSLRQLAALAGCGVLCALGYALVYLGEQSISGGLAAVIYGTFPLCTALAAAVGRVERVRPAAVVGALVAAAGIVVLFADRLDVSRAQGVAVLVVLASVLVSALYTTLMKRAAAGVHPLASTGVFLGTTALVLGALAMAVDGTKIPWPPPVVPTAALVYLAIGGSVVVFMAYFYLLDRVSLMTVSTLVVIEPIIALAVDAAFEHGVTLVARSYAGIAIAGVGVAVSILGTPSRKRAPEPLAPEAASSTSSSGRLGAREVA
jgi:probable blue pigment (indigoidine) exporter